MPNNITIFNDPVLLADFFNENVLKPFSQGQIPLPALTLDEIKQWSITEFEMKSCLSEFIIMAAVGVTVTVKKNKPFKFYSTFIRALAGHLSVLLFRSYGLNTSEETIKVLEKYIDCLEDSIVEFSYMYTNRVFSENPNEVSIIVADLWKRAFDVAIQTMGNSREFFIACMAESLAKNVSNSDPT